MSDTSAEEPEPATPTTAPRAGKIALGVFAAAAVGAALFFGGWLRAHLVAEADAEAAAEVLAESRAETATALTERDSAHARIDTLERTVSLLEARRLLAQSLTDLDERNYGSARGRVVRASALLEESGGIMQELATRLQAIELVDPEQLDAERAAMIAVAASFDEALPATEG